MSRITRSWCPDTDGEGVEYPFLRNQAKRGRARENLVKKALHALWEAGVIRRYECFPSMSSENHGGIDARLYRWDGSTVNFQVKGSGRGVAQHKERYPRIPCVNIGGCTHTNQVIAILRRRFDLPIVSGTSVRRLKEQELLDRVGFIGIVPSKRCTIVYEGHLCRATAVLRVVGYPHIVCCKSRRCRVAAAEQALIGC